MKRLADPAGDFGEEASAALSLGRSLDSALTIAAAAHLAPAADQAELVDDAYELAAECLTRLWMEWLYRSWTSH